jgi:hypothetical protein
MSEHLRKAPYCRWETVEGLQPAQVLPSGCSARAAFLPVEIDERTVQHAGSLYLHDPATSLQSKTVGVSV